MREMHNISEIIVTDKGIYLGQFLSFYGRQPNIINFENKFLEAIKCQKLITKIDPI